MEDFKFGAEKENEFKNFFEILPDEIKEKLKNKIKEKEIINFFNSILSGNIKEHVKPLYIRKNYIYVVVDNPIWGQEFLIYKEHFLKRINGRFNEKFEDIKYKFAPQYFKKEIDVPSYEKLDKNIKKEIDEELKIIEDNMVKDKLKNLFASLFLSEKANKK